jgi:phytanoyl-CoA hydroxylase
MNHSATHSRFGGMWIDRQDWETELVTRRRAGAVKAAEVAQLRRFIAEGYIILPQAASHAAIDRFQRVIAAGFAHGNPHLLYQAHIDKTTRTLDGPVDRLGSRVVDSFVALPEALDLFTTPRLVRFLRLIFDADPLLFQSLSFDQGSQQGLHQDTAYVVVNRPMELAACWIALEDVKPGSGELMYVPGSHRYPDFDFGFGVKHWSGQREHQAAHETWSRWIIDEATARKLPTRTFLARKGDILIWHADLAHGGSPVHDVTLTRQSLVGHFCPAGARPRYFDHGQHRDMVRRYGPLLYSSDHYDLSARPEHAAPQPPPSSWLTRIKSAFHR